MNVPSVSSETVHASCVVKDGRAVLISGRSGSGKSDLALRLIDRGFTLVSDDRTIVRREGDRLVASCPATIAGKLEIRGIGIVDMPHEDGVAVALLVELKGEVPRFPEDHNERRLLGTAVPVVTMDATTASATAKVAVALERLGLKF
jgi:serine kinase of HPr protein (carbohydrate metabolism regulator)